MSDNYKQLLTDFLRETALSGGSAPVSVSTVTGDQAKAAYWIKQADLQIQREWINWDFLWVRAPRIGIAQGSQTFPNFGSSQSTINIGGQDIDLTSNDVNKVIRGSVAIINASGKAHFPCYKNWHTSDFSKLYTYETQTATDTPEYFSVMPPLNGSRTIILSAPVSSSGLFQAYDYYRKPRALVDDTDVSAIPDDFSRLIVVGAKIMYAEHEDAPEVSAGSHEEYEFIMSEMQAIHLPDQSFNRESHPDEDLVVQVE